MKYIFIGLNFLYTYVMYFLNNINHFLFLSLIKLPNFKGTFLQIGLWVTFLTLWPERSIQTTAFSFGVSLLF